MTQQREPESHGRETAAVQAAATSGVPRHRRGSDVEHERGEAAAGTEPERVFPAEPESSEELESEHTPKPVDETDVLSMGGPDSLQNVEQPQDGE